MKTDVLFIGEAPGEIEDIEGKPFWGPSGRTLTSMIEFSRSEFPEMKYAYTSIVSCFPYNDGDRSPRPPTKVEASACSKRLIECIESSRPTLIICVGTVAKNFFPGGFLKAKKNYPFIKGIEHIIHPSFLLRQLESRKETKIAEARLEIRRILRKYL
jgi:DNA polymerase